jgi:23S rRNA pseudoU1915 N3-methylase RlmH
MKNEDKRLDITMEVHRLNSIKETEDLAEIKQRERKEGARQILDQISYNTENRLLEEEKKNAESQALSE